MRIDFQMPQWWPWLGLALFWGAGFGAWDMLGAGTALSYDIAEMITIIGLLAASGGFAAGLIAGARLRLSSGRAAVDGRHREKPKKTQQSFNVIGHPPEAGNGRQVVPREGRDPTGLKSRDANLH